MTAFGLTDEGRKGTSCGNSRRGLSLENDTRADPQGEKPPPARRSVLSHILHLTMMTTRGQTWTTAPRAPGLAPTMQFRWLIGWTGILTEGRNLTHLTPMSAVESWRAPVHRFFWLLVTTYWHWSPNRDDSRGQQLPLLQLQSVCPQCSLKGLIQYCPRWRERHKTGQPQWETETSQSSIYVKPRAWVISAPSPLLSSFLSVFISPLYFLSSVFTSSLRPLAWVSEKINFLRSSLWSVCDGLRLRLGSGLKLVTHVQLGFVWCSSSWTGICLLKSCLLMKLWSACTLSYDFFFPGPHASYTHVCT